ncbi:energy-coupling factor transporter transmembrane component T family protein [Anaerosporobacter faecicola]|uniref:energy-coupling factor transporter transmembrane component T family protein n=1 Tax=Anaerosporobacter faecicola TaxID=2718714 RepID=UPI00143B2535|nr:energy-coupling factor transporter transmembrane component T [Anaerosporobacter faecicola]
MIRDITIGQYYPKDSFIHKLDPRTKIIGTFVFIISLFLFRNKFLPYVVVIGFLGLVIGASQVPIKHIVKGLKSIIFLMVFAIVFNVFLTSGEVLWQWGILKITKEGLENAGFMALRLTLLIMGSSIMTFTTTPNHLTDGLEKIMNPLKRIKVPVHEISMMMSIALRFIPILLEETDKIMKAQMARGADFESGNLIKKAKSLVPLLVPLFVSAFRRANDLAMAMEARCYRGGEGRTKMKPLKYRKEDFISYLILVLYLVSLVVVKKVSPV